MENKLSFFTVLIVEQDGDDIILKDNVRLCHVFGWLLISIAIAMMIKIYYTGTSTLVPFFYGFWALAICKGLAALRVRATRFCKSAQCVDIEDAFFYFRWKKSFLFSDIESLLVDRRSTANAPTYQPALHVKKRWFRVPIICGRSFNKTSVELALVPIALMTDKNIKQKRF